MLPHQLCELMTDDALVCVHAAHGTLPSLDGYSLSGGRLSDWYVRFGDQSCAVVDDSEAPTWDSCCDSFAAGAEVTFELVDYDYFNGDDTCCATSMQLALPANHLANLTLSLSPGEQRFLDVSVERSPQPLPLPPPPPSDPRMTCMLQTSVSSWTGGTSLGLLLRALVLDIPGELGGAALDGGVALAVSDLHCDSMRLSLASLRGWVTPAGRSLVLAASLGAGARCQATLAFSEPFWAAGLSPRVSLSVQGAAVEVEAAAELGPGGGVLNLSMPRSPLLSLGDVDLSVHFDEWYVSDTAVSALVSEAWDLFRTGALQAAVDATEQLLSTSVPLPTPRAALWQGGAAVRGREPWDTWVVRRLLGWTLRPRSPLSLRWLLKKLSDDDGTVALPVPPQPPIPLGSLLGAEAPPINGSGSGGAIAWQLASARLRVPTGTLEDGGDGAGGETLARGTLAVGTVGLVAVLRVGWWPAAPLSVVGGEGLEPVVKPVAAEVRVEGARVEASTVLRLAEEGDGYELLLGELRLEFESVVVAICGGSCAGAAGGHRGGGGAGGGGAGGGGVGGCAAGGEGGSLEFGALRDAEAERLGGLVRDLYNDSPLHVPFAWLRALALGVVMTSALVVAVAIGFCRCVVWWARRQRTASATLAMRARALSPRKVVMV